MIEIAPPRDFFWSLRRYRMWRRCPREYYFHYCAAIGGHDVDNAPRYQRELHAARQRMALNTYCHRVLYMALRREFYAPVPDETEPVWELGSLSGTMLHQMEREFWGMLENFSRRDHRYPMLQELTRPGVSTEAVHQDLKLKLKALAQLAEKALLPKLRQVPVENRRLTQFPQGVRWGELQLHFLPLAVWIEAGALQIIESSPAPEERSMARLLHFYYAQNVCHIAPDRVNSYFYEPDTGRCARWNEPMEISFELQKLRRQLAEVLACYTADGSASQADFPPQEQEYCLNCRFRLFCRGLKNEND